MPRATRSGLATATNNQTNGQAGLQLRSNKTGLANSKTGLNVNKTGLGNNKKRKVVSEPEENAVQGKMAGKPATKRRAALGEITNAFAETSSQVQKSFSKMLNKSKSKPKLTTSNPNSTKKTIALDPVMTLKKSKSADEVEMKLALLEEEAAEVTKGHEGVIQIQSGDGDLGMEEEEEEVYESAEEEEVDPRFPRPAVDFDKEQGDDPNQCSVYAKQIFAYYKSREAQFKLPDYMKAGVQTEVTITMRSILVDWLVEVQESFELNHETLYTAVKMMDIYLSREKHVPKNQLQLVGAVSALIACKIDERIPPLLDDFVYVCDDAYTKDEIKALERKMIDVVGYDFGYPLTYRFLRRYARVCGTSMAILTFARYILEVTLMEYNLNVETSESKLALAALMVAFKINKVEGQRINLEYYSGYKLEEVEHLCIYLHKMLRRPASDSRKTIRTKYSHEVFHMVARTAIPESLDFSDL